MGESITPIQSKAMAFRIHVNLSAICILLHPIVCSSVSYHRYCLHYSIKCLCELNNAIQNSRIPILPMAHVSYIRTYLLYTNSLLIIMPYYVYAYLLYACIRRKNCHKYRYGCMLINYRIYRKWYGRIISKKEQSRGKWYVCVFITYKGHCCIHTYMRTYVCM